MPCVEWFDEQDAAYREQVLPAAVRARVSIEAGIALGWREFIGDAGRASAWNISAPQPTTRSCTRVRDHGRRVAEAARDSLAGRGSGLDGGPQSEEHDCHDTTDTLAQLERAGRSIWLDDISRERLVTGNLAGLARDMHVAA